MTKIASIQFKSKIHRLQHLLNMHYIEIPNDVIQHFGGKFKIRLMCTINNRLTFQAGVIALGNGNGYISINIKRLKELEVKFGDTVQVVLVKDESKYGMPIPKELQELLEQDDDAKRRFDILTEGKQRYIIYYVSQVQSSQLRIERALLLLTNLKKTKEGKETFRQMLGLV